MHHFVGITAHCLFMGACAYIHVCSNLKLGDAAQVCEVYSISEKAMGDVIDRKQAQVEHAAKEEREFSEKYQVKRQTIPTPEVRG
jgi:hypothetical protein